MKKKIATLAVGLIMLVAALVASGEPAPGTSGKTIVLTDAVCVSILVGGAFYLRHAFPEDEQ